MESQRVSCLTEGYLRGWLTFEYACVSSRIREELVLRHIETARLSELLQHKLLVECILASPSERRSKDIIGSIFDTKKALIELKLPSLLPKDTIEEDNKVLTATDMSEWKSFLDKVNKK